MDTGRRNVIFWVGVLLVIAVYQCFNPFRLEHLVVAGIFIGLWLVSTSTRRLAFGLIPVGIYVYLYDFMSFFEPRSFDVVIVEPLYVLESQLFGWIGGGLGPVDFFKHYNHIAIDVLGGLWYASHLPVFVLLIGWLWWESEFRDADVEGRIVLASWGFLLMNLVGMVIQALFPMAPPWYVWEYGLTAPGEPIQGSPAALARVDTFIHFPYFESIYKKGSYVFGAFPSLHASISLWVALVIEKGFPTMLAGLYAMGMSFFAVYLGHHYIIDILAGWFLAVGVYGIAHQQTVSRALMKFDACIRELMSGNSTVNSTLNRRDS